MANNIPTLQNDAKAIRYLAAQRRLYGQAKWVMAIQVVLVVLLPLGLVIAERFLPKIKVGAAAVDLIIAVLDVILLVTLKDSLQKQAAAIQESFDCYVFGLDWPELKAEKPDPEDVEELSAGFNTDSLKNWYPPTVGTLVHHAAVAVCQRSNSRWDAKLRRKYRTTLLVLATILVLSLIAIALGKDLVFHDLVLVVLAPALPVVLWAFREATDQKEAAERADRLKEFGNELWSKILDGSLSAQPAMRQSRLFQDAILAHRQRSPMVFDWFYRLFRKPFEEQMGHSADEMIEEAARKGLIS